MNEPMVEDLDGVFFGVVARLLGEDFGDGFGDGFGDLVRAGEAAARFFGGISIERGDTCLGRARGVASSTVKSSPPSTHAAIHFGVGHPVHPQFYINRKTQSSPPRALAHTSSFYGCQAKGAELGYSKKSLFVCHSCHISTPRRTSTCSTGSRPCTYSYSCSSRPPPPCRGLSLYRSRWRRCQSAA